MNKYIRCISLFLIISMNSLNLYSQHKFEVLRGWQKYINSSNFLYEILANHAYSQIAERNNVISGNKSLEDWKERASKVKRKLDDLIGPFPDKTPLNAKVMGRVEKDDFIIENIVFESRPNFYVTSSLFIPKQMPLPAPAILNMIGHSITSYRRDIYQHEILNLVRKGFIVFTFDPIGQGERIQYYNPDTKESFLGGSTHQHSYLGAQAFIAGNSLASYEIWDGIRAIDYLFSRKEVDTSRIGVTGLSGGGTQSAYMGAIDDRIYAAAPSNYITNFCRLIESIGPQDAEQNLFHGIAKKLDHPDLIEVRAPKPTLMITTTRDFFPIQGSIETEREIRKIYKSYNKSDYFLRVEDDSVHTFTKKNNESMYSFFQTHLKNPGDSIDINVEPLRTELQITETGQVETSFNNAKNVFDLIQEEAIKKEISLRKRRASKDFLIEAKQKAEVLSGYNSPTGSYKPVFTGRFQENGFKIEKYYVEIDEYALPFLLLVPNINNGKAVISLSSEGKSKEIGSRETKWLLKNGFTVLIPDLLGIGELGSGKYKGDSFINNTPFGLWFLSVLTAKSITGLRAESVNILVKLLIEWKGFEDIYGFARSSVATSLVYAALFNRDIKKITLFHALSSYQSLVSTPFYDSDFLFDAVASALAYYDIPDLEAGLAPRDLNLVGLVDGENKPLKKDEINIMASYIHNSYRKNNNDNNFRLFDYTESNLNKIFYNWINK